MDTENYMSLIDEMREGRCCSASAFLVFTSKYRLFSDHVFCFYEGEDGKYYNQKIKGLIGESIVPIIVGNKQETLRLWRRLKDDSLYKGVHKMFFVDRDMDNIPDDKDDDLYVTPCYSIENFYANRFCFSNIIESEFLVNKTDNDYKKCMDLFEKMFNEFNQIMLGFNALVYLKAKNSINSDGVNACDIQTKKLVSIDDKCVKPHRKHSNEIEKYRSALAVSEEEFEAAKCELSNRGSFEQIFRGKNQLDFLSLFIKYLKQLHSKGEFFEVRRNTVKIVIDKNRLSQLSQYAVFPECLKAFIVLHKIT